MHLNRLEGPALQAYLLMRRQAMVEAARVQKYSFQEAWDIELPEPEDVILLNLRPRSKAKLRIRNLQPKHLNIPRNATTEYGYMFPSLKAGENTEVISRIIPRGVVVGIHGILDNTTNPALVQVDINIAGREARAWCLREGESEVNDQIYFLDPIVVPEGKKLTVDFWMATAGNEKVQFLGLRLAAKSRPFVFF